MKKIILLSGIITLTFLFAETCRADMACPGQFMRVQGRDAYNRPVESTQEFETTAYFETYSRISRFGVLRWRRAGSGSATLGEDLSFRVPFAAIPYIQLRDAILRFTEEIFATSPAGSLIAFMLILTAVLAFKQNLQTTTEPRFRVPVYLE